ncbi:Immunoglobulin-like and fibronectin type III domain-containing protein 1 [Triplophysa tibetana]|nr:Immunoglobulin-like and fibronectin type III domain-containing protein 1 [Triplophysa tibetana]
MKHNLNQVGKKYIFTIKDLLPDDAGLYQLDVENANRFSTQFKNKGHEGHGEGFHAIFKCILTKPLSKIMWVGRNNRLEQRDKYDIRVSEDKLIHRLVLKDCKQMDNSIKSCYAWLLVEALKDKPGPLQGPIEVRDSSSSVIELKWKPPGDTGGSDVTNYLLERQQVGQNMWKKVWDGSADRLSFRDRNVARGKKYRIYAENPEGVSNPLETENIMAGALN